VKRLAPSDRRIAKQLFSMMALVFEEDHEDLSDGYVDGLLSRDDFWLLAARSGDDVIGGLSAHTLPMTRSESREIFIYDIAVRADHQRRGVGRQLIVRLREIARDLGITELFVPADVGDAHALAFYRAMGATETSVAFFTFGRMTR
jgi:aminoglycoside 3-N-acetyltransferase I